MSNWNCYYSHKCKTLFLLQLSIIYKYYQCYIDRDSIRILTYIFNWYHVDEIWFTKAKITWYPLFWNTLKMSFLIQQYAFCLGEDGAKYKSCWWHKNQYPYVNPICHLACKYFDIINHELRCIKLSTLFCYACMILPCISIVCNTWIDKIERVNYEEKNPH